MIARQNDAFELFFENRRFRKMITRQNDRRNPNKTALDKMIIRQNDRRFSNLAVSQNDYSTKWSNVFKLSGFGKLKEFVDISIREFVQNAEISRTFWSVFNARGPKRALHTAVDPSCVWLFNCLGGNMLWRARLAQYRSQTSEGSLLSPSLNLE